MRQAITELAVSTTGQGMLECTREVVRWVGETGIATGLLTLFIPHTSASLVIQENAAPAARRDLQRYFGQLVSERASYEHSDEGPDDMPAHIRAALTATSLSIPVAEGRPVLGTWQGIYLFEHRRQPHHRKLVLHLLGE